MEGDTIAWSDIKPSNIGVEKFVKTNIICPKCGKRLFRQVGIILASCPPKYIYECHNCDFKGYNY